MTLRQLRARLMTQVKAADALGVSWAWLDELERGNHAPGRRTRERMCALYGIGGAELDAAVGETIQERKAGQLAKAKG